MLTSPQRSQWRGRAGFSPASLLSLNKKHQKQTAHLDYALGGLNVKCALPSERERVPARIEINVERFPIELSSVMLLIVKRIRAQKARER